MKKLFIFLTLGIVISFASVASAANFKDVPAGSWYEQPVNDLQKNGIIQGFPDGTYQPTKNVNRAEMAKMLHNFMIYVDNSYQRKGTTTTQLKQTQTAKVQSRNTQGFIEGSLSYLSGRNLPNDLRICAHNVETGEEYCTTNILSNQKYAGGYGYELKVPAGRYQVYAQSNKFNQEQKQGDYKAYYSEYVTCGMGTNCTSHNPVTFRVREDGVAVNINPNDWYNTPATKGKGLPQGRIEGSLSYFGGKLLPDDLRICAQNIQTGEDYCTTEVIWSPALYSDGRGYRINVPAGQYQVYAYSSKFDRDQNQSNYRAYYSEYVTCTGQNCTSHAPINVSVGENKTIRNVNPTDWYNNTGLNR